MRIRRDFFIICRENEPENRQISQASTAAPPKRCILVADCVALNCHLQRTKANGYTGTLNGYRPEYIICFCSNAPTR